MKKLATVILITTLLAGCSGRQKLEAGRAAVPAEGFSSGGAANMAPSFNQDGGGLGLAPAGVQAAPELRIRMLLTALSFDRSLARRAGDTVHIGTMGECPSAVTLHQSQGKEMNGLPIRVHAAPSNGTAAALGDWVKEKGIKVLYLCELPSEAHTLAGILEADSVTLLADNPTWVGSFASMGVVRKDGHPRLLVNLENARAAGMRFDSSIYASAVLIAN